MAQTLIEGVTNYWCRTQGIHSQDLTTHPQIDDVIMLIKFIEEYQRDFTAKQRVELHLIWHSCYNNKKPLGTKYLKALTHIGQRITLIRHHKAQAVNKARERIKALRKQ
jgi:hypothetical protein